MRKLFLPLFIVICISLIAQAGKTRTAWFPEDYPETTCTYDIHAVTVYLDEWVQQASPEHPELMSQGSITVMESMYGKPYWVDWTFRMDNEAEDQSPYDSGVLIQQTVDLLANLGCATGMLDRDAFVVQQNASGVYCPSTGESYYIPRAPTIWYEHPFAGVKLSPQAMFVVLNAVLLDDSQTRWFNTGMVCLPKELSPTGKIYQAADINADLNDKLDQAKIDYDLGDDLDIRAEYWYEPESHRLDPALYIDPESRTFGLKISYFTDKAEQIHKAIPIDPSPPLCMMFQ